jgi:hypothetical protein
VDVAGRGLPPQPDDGRDSPGPDIASGLLGRMLLGCATDRGTGVLCVVGEPGGTVRLADGMVVAVDTPGAPGPEVILLRSGRVPESGWAAAFNAAAADGPMGAELVRRGLIGNGELEAVLRAVLADGMFALAGGHVDECRLEQAAVGCLLPLEPPADPGWLLSEMSRRQHVLASMPNPVAHDRDRVRRGPSAAPGATLDTRQDEILALANGRRTARDMAFVLGCGVYALTLEFARMNDRGLLAIGSRRDFAASQPSRPGPPADLPESQGDGPDTGVGDPVPGPPLPRRRKTKPGTPRRPQAADGEQGGSSALLRLLRPGSVNDQAAGK